MDDGDTATNPTTFRSNLKAQATIAHEIREVLAGSLPGAHGFCLAAIFCCSSLVAARRAAPAMRSLGRASEDIDICGLRWWVQTTGM